MEKKKAFVWEPSIEERLRPKLRLNETGGSPANLGLQWEGFFLKNRMKLVVSTQLKNLSQIGNLPQVGVRMKNIWNHHPAWFSSCFKQVFFEDLRTCCVRAIYETPFDPWDKEKRQLATDEFAPHLRSAPVAGNGRMEKPQWKRKCLKVCGIGTNWNRTKLQLVGKNPSVPLVTIFIAANAEKRFLWNGGKKPLTVKSLDLMIQMNLQCNHQRICWDLSATLPGNSIASSGAHHDHIDMVVVEQ